MHGAYVYHKGGERLDIEETFDIGEISSSARRLGFGHTLRVNVLERPNHKVVDLTLFNNQLQVTVQYHFNGYSWRAYHYRGIEYTEHDLPTTAIFFPLMRCYTGKMIRHIVAQGGMATVIVPDIRDPYNRDTVLLPLFEERTAQKLSEETILIGDQTYQTEVFSYIGGAYDDAARFWLVGDMLVRYVFQDWDVELLES